MPVLTLENVGQLSDSQKEQLIEKLTEVVCQITRKPAQAVYVRIDEVSPKNFGVGGKPLG